MLVGSTRMGRAVAVLLLASATVPIAQDNPPRPPDFVVPSPPPEAPAPVTSATKLPAGHLEEIGTQLGLNPCDYNISRRAVRPINAVALVGGTGERLRRLRQRGLRDRCLAPA